MTVGPWKPISLQTSQKRITNLDIRTYVSESLDVKLTVEFALSGKTPGYAIFVLKNPNGSEETSVNSIPTDTGNVQLSFEWEPGKVQLWYPVGYGAQPIYTVQVKLVDKVSVAVFRTLSCEALPDVNDDRKETRLTIDQKKSLSVVHAWFKTN